MTENKLKQYSYWFIDSIYDDKHEKLYFMGANVSGLFEWDFKTNQVVCLHEMRDIEFENERYDCGVKYGSKLFFPPRNTFKMAVFDINLKEMLYMDLYTNDELKQIGYEPSFLGHFVINIGNRIILIYRKRVYITSMNADTGVFYKIDTSSIPKDVILSKSYSYNDGIYYFVSQSTNGFLSFNTNTDSIEYHELEVNEDISFSSCMCRDNNLLILSSDGKYLFEYSMREKTVKISKTEIETYNKEVETRWKLTDYNHKILIVPMLDTFGEEYNKSIYVLGEQYRIIQAINSFDKYKDLKKWCIRSLKGEEWYAMFEANNNDYVDNCFAEGLVIGKLDLQTFTISEVQVPIPIGMSKEEMSERIEFLQNELYLKDKEIILENNRFSLSSFI